MRIEEKKLELRQLVNSNKRHERGDLERQYKNRIKIDPLLNRKIVSFQANKNIPFYRWYEYREGFSAQIVKMLLKESQKKSGTVLDPFAGVGTTLFAARDMGFNSFGIELLPIGEFVFKSRLAVDGTDSNKLLHYLKLLRTLDFSKLPVNENRMFKHIPITQKAFSQINEYKINAFLNHLEKIKDSKIQQILRFACFCVLENISYTSKDGQFLRWDSRAGKSKSNFNKHKIHTFEEALIEKLDQIIQDIRNSEVFQHSLSPKGSMTLKTGSSLEILPTLEDESFDLVITSPPYCNRYDYTRTYALELAYLGINDQNVKNLRQNLLSCTVENKDKKEFLQTIYSIKNRMKVFRKCEGMFYSTPALQEILTILGKYLDNQLLNNTGIYRMVRNYFYEHSFIISELARILKNNGRIYYINDNVRFAGEIIPVDLILSKFAEKAGLTVRKISILENPKGNSSQQMSVFGRQTLRKCIYHWEKH